MGEDLFWKDLDCRRPRSSKIMQAWSDFLDKLKAGAEIIPIRATGDTPEDKPHHGRNRGSLFYFPFFILTLLLKRNLYPFLFM